MLEQTPPGPLSELPLADLFVAAEGEDFGLQVLLNLAEQLDRRQKRDWYIYNLVPADIRWLGRALDYFDDEPSDSVELEVGIRSWTTASLRKADSLQRLWRVRTSLEIACWCEPDHGVHAVQEVCKEVGSVDGLATACDSALDAIDGWLRDRALPADKWRLRAGLPTRDA